MVSIAFHKFSGKSNELNIYFTVIINVEIHT